MVRCPVCGREIGGRSALGHLEKCAKAASKPKYRNVKTASGDGIVHASGLEAERWLILCELQRLKEISGLRRQVRFALRVNGRLVCRYVADFVYRRHGRLVVEDAKGFVTPVFSIKEKLFFAVTGIHITRVQRGKRWQKRF